MAKLKKHKQRNKISRHAFKKDFSDYVGLI